jgi:hypothetical protein
VGTTQGGILYRKNFVSYQISVTQGFMANGSWL